MKQAVLKQQGVLAIADVQEDLTLQADEVLVEVKLLQSADRISATFRLKRCRMIYSIRWCWDMRWPAS